MRKKFTMLLAALFLVMGTAWAQTAAGIVGNPTTTLTDGKYVVVAMSDKGTGPCYYHTVGDRHYRYDLNKSIKPGYVVTSDYVWTIDETTEGDVQHITITNLADDNKFFVKDAAKNQNFGGSEKASLKVEKKTISGKDYIALTLDDANIGYIYVNAPGGNPNLSYWPGYSDEGACTKFTFYPLVELDVAGENLPLERKSTFAVNDEMYIYSTCRVSGTTDWTGFFTNNNGSASLIKEKPTNLFTEGNDPIWVIASLETLQTADETPKTYYKVTLKNKATDKYLGIGGVTTNATVEDAQTFYISQWKNPVFAGNTESRQGVMPGTDVWSENVDGTALASGNITANDPIWVVQAATGNCFNTNGRQYMGGNNVAYPIVFYSVGDKEDIEQKYFDKINEVNTTIASAESLFSTAGFTATPVALQVTQADAAGYIKCNNLDPDEGNDMSYLIDNNPSTYIHSNYHNKSSEKDYLEVYLGEGNGMSLFYFTEITRGDAQADYASSIEILGSEDGSSFEPITTVSGLPVGNSKSYTSPLIKSDSKYKYLRFVVTGSNYAADRPFFHMAEFDLYSVAINEESARRGDIFCALNEAVQNGEKAIADLNFSAMNSAKTAMDELIAEGSVTYPFTLTTDDENPVLYAIKSGRTNRNQGWWYTYDPSDQKIGLTQFTMANTQFWYFKEIVKNNKVYLQLYPAAGEGKAMSYNNTNNAAGNVIAKDVNNTENYKSTWLLEVVNGKYGLQTEGRENRLSNNGGVEENGVLTNKKMGMWNADPNSDAGSAMYLFEKPKYPFTLTTDDADPQYCGIKSGRTDNGQEWWYTYITEGDDAGKILLSAYTGAKNQMWYFKEVASDKNAFGLQLYPAAGGGKAMSYNNTNSVAGNVIAETIGAGGWNSTWILETTNGTQPYGLQTEGKENRLSNNGGVMDNQGNLTNNKMGMWNAAPSSDGGSAMYFSDPAATLQDLIDEAKAKAVSGHDGEVGYFSVETAEALRAAIAQAETNKANKDYELTALKNAVAALSLILPEADKYYQIKSANPSFYAKQGKEMGIYSSNASGQLAWKALDAADKAFYWTITPKNGKFVFKNEADDKYVPAIADDAYVMTETESEAAEFTLTWLALGQFNINGNGTMHMAGHSEGAGTDDRICSWNGGINSSSAWTIVEVEHPDLSMAKAGLQNCVDQLNTIIANMGSAIGQYKDGDKAALQEHIATAQGVLNSGSPAPNEYTTAKDALEEAIAVLDYSLILPQAGKHYLIKSAKPEFFANQGVEMAMYSDATNGLLYWKALNELDRTFYWTITPNNDGTSFVFQNAGDQKYIPAIADDQYTMTEDANSAQSFNLSFLGSRQFNITGSGTMHMMGHSNGNGKKGRICGFDGGLNTPSAWYIIEIDNLEWTMAVLELEIAILDAMRLLDQNSTEIGYYSSNEENLAEKILAINNFKIDIKEDTPIADIQEQIELANEIVKSFKINLPGVGFYRIKNYSETGHLICGEPGGRSQFGSEKEKSIESIFCYAENKLVSYKDGMSFAIDNDNKLIYKNEVGTGIDIIFEESLITGKLQILFNNTRYLFSENVGDTDSGSAEAKKIDPTGGSPAGRNANYLFTVEKVTTLPVTISSAQVEFDGQQKYVSTLFTPVALKIPDGITAYIGVNEDNYLAMKSLENIIPANTGVILMADVYGTYNFDISTAAGTAIESGANIITGTVAKTIITPAANTTCYVLAKKDEKVGLYRASLNKNDGTGFINNACKAYIPVSVAEPQAAKALTMRLGRGSQGGTTSIESSELNAQGSALIYDLQGRRVLNPTKGMYIVNGKKVLF